MADPTRRPWKTGFEIELMAPRGLSRRDLAARIANRVGGRVHTVFYPQSEPSLVPGMPVFENLVLGFEVLSAAGERVALCVDDLTLRDGLDPQAAPLPGWMRILSDDARLLALVTEHCDPDADTGNVLTPIATLFGTRLEHTEGGIAKVVDRAARSIAMVAPLPGERERPCELITPPYERDPGSALAALLEDARALGFTVPAEAAVHVHFDAAPLRSARTLSRLVTFLARHGDELRHRVGTNPRCVRLGPIADTLVDLASSKAFLAADWDKARAMLIEAKPTKYADFNFLNLAHELPGKTTFEARIFPGSMDLDEILRNARLMESVLGWAAGDDAEPGGDRFCGSLGLSAADRAFWEDRADP
ncbi:amidoligase family protein [Maricaulis sp.]|uniref:amidoligase family protein n=1 Tax=Maricaulis sp. TaxID=1486257 RepID=UPI0025BD11B9|nr:amidoligase family protein [Maricaulis sp.]